MLTFYDSSLYQPCWLAQRTAKHLHQPIVLARKAQIDLRNAGVCLRLRTVQMDADIQSLELLRESDRVRGARHLLPFGRDHGPRERCLEAVAPNEATRSGRLCWKIFRNQKASLFRDTIGQLRVLARVERK